MNIKYTKENLEEAVTKCKSFRQLIQYFGLKESGGSYNNFKKRIDEYKIDISHWGNNAYRQGWNRGLTRATSNKMKNIGYTKEEIFVENSSVSTRVVRSYLEGETSFIHMCEICKNTEWMGQKISLDLDHKNGNNRDNRRENLQFICPNCHAQTHTYRGKNINKNKKKITDETLLEILKKSPSIRVALMTAGMTPKGGNYTRIYRLIHENDLQHLIK